MFINDRILIQKQISFSGWCFMGLSSQASHCFDSQVHSWSEITQRVRSTKPSRESPLKSHRMFFSIYVPPHVFNGQNGCYFLGIVPCWKQWGLKAMFSFLDLNANGGETSLPAMINRAGQLARMLPDLEQSSNIARFDGIGLYFQLLRGWLNQETHKLKTSLSY